MSPKYADIIIDAGSRDTAGLRAALTVADVALVPFQPRSFDLWTLDKVISLITEAKPYRDEPLRTVACSEGRGVCELKRQDPKASAEMTALVRAVFDGIAAIS